MAGPMDSLFGAVADAGQYIREKTGIEHMMKASIMAPYSYGYSEAKEIDGNTDAMRHLMISGMLANKFGRLPAKGLGYLHEALSPSTYNSFLMDASNNDVGSRIGASLPRGASDSEIAAAMQNAMKGARKSAPPGFFESSSTPVFMK